jgi:hypothetical protein
LERTKSIWIGVKAVKTTGNLGLKKPEGTDNVDIADLNGNMDILDTAVKAVQDHAADTVKHISATERSTWNAKETTAGAQAKADAVQTNLTTHTGNTTAHITAAERTAWNAKASTTVVTTAAAGLMAAADKMLLNNNTGYGTTAGTATAYTVTLSPAPTLAPGMKFSFKAHVASGANPTLNPNGLGAKPIKKPNGNAAALALNGVYTVVYDGTNFILQGEGGEYGNATASQVLSGTTFGTENGLSTGTMPDYSEQRMDGEVYVQDTQPTQLVVAPTVSGGYFNRWTTFFIKEPNFIPANIKSGVTMFDVEGGYTADATATVDDILEGKSAYVNGKKIEGQLWDITNQATGVNMHVQDVSPGKLVVFPAIGGNGVVNNQTTFNMYEDGFISSNIMSGMRMFGMDGTATSDATATPADIAANKSAYVNGNKVWGTMPVISEGADPAQGVGKWGDGALAVYPREGYRKGGAGAGEIKVSPAQLQSAEPAFVPSNIRAGVSIYGVSGNMSVSPSTGVVNFGFVAPSSATANGITWTLSTNIGAGKTAIIAVNLYCSASNNYYVSSSLFSGLELWLSAAWTAGGSTRASIIGQVGGANIVMARLSGVSYNANTGDLSMYYSYVTSGAGTISCVNNALGINIEYVYI